MLVKGRVKLGGTFFKMAFHLSKTSVQKGLLMLNVCEVGGESAKKKMGSSWVRINKNLHISRPA